MLPALIRRLLFLLPVFLAVVLVAAPLHAAPELVAVAGAEGRTGRLVVRELLAAGHAVRALVREPGGQRPDGVSAVVADVRKPATLTAGLAGAVALVIAIGGRRGEAGNGPEQVEFQGVANLAEAARIAGLRQVVLVSSAGVTQEDHPLNRMFDNVLRWKARGEAALVASGTPYTIVRPGGLTDADTGPGGVRFDQGDRGTGFIPRADVARICVAALREPAARNRIFEAYAAGGGAPPDWGRLFGALTAGTTGAAANVR